MLRWRKCESANNYQDGVNYDMEDTAAYLQWESNVLENANVLKISAEQKNAVKEISMSNIDTIRASSTLSEYNMSHSANRLVDGNLTTAWVEGVDGQGIGEYVIFELDDIYRVKGFDIYPGYHKKYSLFQKNSRPREIMVEFSDGTSETYWMSDSMEKQTFVFDEEKKTDFIKVIIKDVYPGSKYKDTVISEIRFY
jgi:hypothetical protein